LVFCICFILSFNYSNLFFCSFFYYSTILFFYYKTSSTCGAGQYQTIKAFKHFGDYCSSSNRCDTCEGDCDADNHCQGELKCFKRSNHESVPGCSGGDDRSGEDYCYGSKDGSSSR